MSTKKNSNGHHQKGQNRTPATIVTTSLPYLMSDEGHIVQGANEGETVSARAIQGTIQKSKNGSLKENRTSKQMKGEETPFSQCLATILHRDRPEITRIARALHITENTVYRWMKGNCAPREGYLKKLPDLLPAQRYKLSQAIEMTFPGVVDIFPSERWQIDRDLHKHILQQVAEIANPIDRLWAIARSIFNYISAKFNGERKGITLTFARLSPAQSLNGDIHSLREEVVLPTRSEESKIFLGSTSLAGNAAITMRIQIWDSSHHDNRIQVAIDENEACACAIPVVRGGQIAGILIISSALPGLFSDSLVQAAAHEFAQLLASSLLDTDFQPSRNLLLAPMPSIKLQRAKLDAEYHQRIYAYIDKHNASLRDAIVAIQAQIEKEFEEFEHLGSHMLH